MVNKQKVIGEIWDTQGLVLFGKWLITKGERGYGLLIIHGASLGIKIGDQLKLKWGNFIDPATNECETILHFDNDRKNPEEIGYRELNEFIQRITTNVFRDLATASYSDYIYIKEKTGQVLNTSTLNRELLKFQEEFKIEVYKKTSFDMDYRDIQTNTLITAWGRDMVLFYALSKKSFIAVSKFLGHRTLKDTIKLLQLEPRDEINLRFDFFIPTLKMEQALDDTLKKNILLEQYFVKNKIAGIFYNASEKITNIDSIQINSNETNALNDAIEENYIDASNKVEEIFKKGIKKVKTK